MTSFSFASPSSAPATTGLSGGFNFGANKPATPGFGLTATSQPSTGLFGSTPATSTALGTSFGSTSFGANTTPAFGAATSAFGASTATPAFGTTTPAFGAATSAPSFGTTPASGLGTSFGATTTPSFGLGTGGLNFGAGTNTSAPSTGLSFGGPIQTATAPSLGGLGGFNFTPAAAQSTAGFSFLSNTSVTTTTANSLFDPMHPFNANIPLTQTFQMIPPNSTPVACGYTVKSASRDLYKTITPSGGCGPKLGGTTVTSSLSNTAATSSVGLGGVSSLSSGAGAGNAATDAKSDPPKQQKLPNEILVTVENFKNFVKKQKSLSSEVMRVSVKPLHTVSRQAEETLRAALSLQSAAVRARSSARLQRHAAVTAIAAAEAAARDHAHPGSELEGSAPPPYVKELIAELEQKLIAFRAHMDSADKQMQSSPKLLTEQELNLGFRRMHESLVALAARLQVAHAAVEAQKEQYLNLRKYILKDPTNVFDNPTPTSTLDQILKDLDGGRKKLKSGNTVDGSAVVADPRAALGSMNLAGPSPFGYGGALSPFPLADNSAPAWQPQATPVANTSLNTSFGAPAVDSSFQLQRPPGKRGKQ